MLVTTAGCIVARMETIGTRIAAAREHKGLNQSELGRLLGVTPQSVQAWESDKNVPRPKRLGEIADALGVTVSTLVGDTAQTSLTLATGAGKSSAASMVLEMLKKHAGKGLNDEARERIAQAVAENLVETTQERPSNVIAGDFPRPPRLVDGDILIPQYDVRASMGHGQVPADYAEFVRNVVVSGPQLEKLGLEYTSPANLSIITGWGQSMAGTIEDKDPLIVDRGVTEFAGDGIYVLTWDDHLYIKRLQKADTDHFDLISDNPKHKDRVVHVDEVTIHARVLYVWRGMKV
ncbi:S24 family peptidase [Pseudomonas sp. JS3066]|uniref:XRE family transcriptional regulator n=1 Tax=Pseudomonas sp. JS3066 TaxID=3090665 RepID=UPI002E7BCCAF|nr:S24 family peptidase [Pseudomonas sp. JS3066]WVK90921.1 S24 family peptidase [Pseudomonas sp. JS3066]